MNYLVITNSNSSREFATHLVNEIRRFDIRARIFHNEGRLIVENEDDKPQFESHFKPIQIDNLEKFDLDLAIMIGETFDVKLTRKLSSQGVKTCFLQITNQFDKALFFFKKAIERFDKVFVDFPIFPESSKSTSIGTYKSDVIRRHEFRDDSSNGLAIGLVLNNPRNAKKLIRAISTEIRDCTWYIIDNLHTDRITSHLNKLANIRLEDNKLNLLKKVNAVVVDSEPESITAALLNCPQISIAGTYRLFSFSSTDSIINKAVKKNLVKSFRPNQHQMIQKELMLLLNDHEYCASLLAGYQEFKEKAGTQPVCRRTAKELIEWLEEES